MSFEYQEVGIDFLRENPRALLGSDPGLGKSRQSIIASQGTTLVVSPAMLKGTWQDEINRWSDDPSRFSWTSYHQLYKQLDLNIQWDTIIYDEATHLKGHKTKWTKVALQLKSKRTFLLTGTPIANYAHELYISIKMLHRDFENQYPWNSRWRWIETWFQTWQPPWGGVQIQGLKDGLTWEDFYTGNDLDTLMLRHTREEVLKDLPPLTEQYISTPMVPAQKRLYNDLKKQYLAWVEENGTEVSAFSSGGLHIKLAKVQTGIVSVDPTVTKFHSNKLEVLRELLEERRGQPTLVVCHFRNTAAAIGRLLEDMHFKYDSIIGGMAQSKRDAAKDSFQLGRLDVLVGTLDSISEGLTLTRADCCVFVERSWKTYKNEQAKRRLHRIGQDRPVSIIYLITDHALDDRITKVLAEKTDQQVMALRAGQLASML